MNVRLRYRIYTLIDSLALIEHPGKRGASPYNLRHRSAPLFRSFAPSLPLLRGEAELHARFSGQNGRAPFTPKSGTHRERASYPIPHGSSSSLRKHSRRKSPVPLATRTQHVSIYSEASTKIYMNGKRVRARRERNWNIPRRSSTARRTREPINSSMVITRDRRRRTGEGLGAQWH